MKEKKLNGSKILSAVKVEVETVKATKEKSFQKTSNACDSYCSGDNYCSDWHDA